ncbi:hypothetical protein LWI28_019959 [Acer negundo]|uniref:Uncharacterized protein n=1 Tax=Acer negundo TaxID=4023 RepID=A0AAD5J7B3_ACENE|nr:hypothetical protein LWI28_019959 [Acer negundo]
MNKHFLGFIDNLKGTEIPYPPRICAWQIDGGKEQIEGRNVSKTEENPDVVSSVEDNTGRVLDKRKGLMRKKEVVVAHPWPKWIERLVKQNYFDHKRKDEDKMTCFGMFCSYRELEAQCGHQGLEIALWSFVVTKLCEVFIVTFGHGIRPDCFYHITTWPSCYLIPFLTYRILFNRKFFSMLSSR